MNKFERAVKHLEGDSDGRYTYTGADVADFLDDLGIRGRRGSIHQCPLVNYVIKVTRTRQRVYSDGQSLFYQRWGRVHRLDLPAGVADFILRFDAGWIPALDVESYPEQG